MKEVTGQLKIRETKKSRKEPTVPTLTPRELGGRAKATTTR
jgi:hypothetical protein